MPFFQENKKNIEYFLSFRNDVIKSLFDIKKSEIPFDVIERDKKLPINQQKTNKKKKCIQNKLINK